MAFFMFWEVLWPLTLGFVISAIVQTVVSKQAIVRTLGKDDLRGVTFATLFGAASSSCSYAAVAISRGLFRRGASLANAILFEFASTNLVFELGIVLFVLLGALAAWVPNSFWQALFLARQPGLSAFWDPIVAPIISLLSFVCSVGNIPLAVVLWNGGISFGGVISFIFADLIIIPIVNIYRKYYGARMSLYLLITSYVAMVLAGFVIGEVFPLFGLAPAHHFITVFQTSPTWNYTTFLDFAALALIALLVSRFLATDGLALLRAMDRPVGHAPEHHDH